MTAMNTLILFFTTVLGFIGAQANILQPITPKISWTNIGIEVPTITIFFQTDFKTKNILKDPWLKI